MSGRCLLFMAVLLILTLILGIALSVYSLVVINSVGVWQTKESITFALIVIELFEILGDSLMNHLCLS